MIEFIKKNSKMLFVALLLFVVFALFGLGNGICTFAVRGVSSGGCYYGFPFTFSWKGEFFPLLFAVDLLLFAIASIAISMIIFRIKGILVKK